MSRRKREPPHDLTRGRALDVLKVRQATMTAPKGVSVLAAALAPQLLVILVDLSVQGSRYAFAGRDYLGKALQEASADKDRRWHGQPRDRFCPDVVGQVIRVLTAYDLVDTVMCWNRPAHRYLSESLLKELKLIVRERRKKKQEPAAPSSEEQQRRQRQSQEAAEAAAFGPAAPIPAAPVPAPVPATPGAATLAREMLKRAKGPPRLL